MVPSPADPLVQGRLNLPDCFSIIKGCGQTEGFQQAVGFFIAAHGRRVGKGHEQPALFEIAGQILVGKKVAEEFRVAVRNVRRDAIDLLKKQKKDKEISEDDLFKLQDDAQSETDSYIAQIEEITASKEKEVMEV